MTRSTCSSVIWRGAPGRGSSPGRPAGGPQTATVTWSPWAATPQPISDLTVAGPLTTGQQDPAALGQRLAGGAPPGPALQRGSRWLVRPSAAGGDASGSTGRAQFGAVLRAQSHGRAHSRHGGLL